MYQYVRKNPTESAKSISSDKGKKSVAKKQRIFGSSILQYNRQVSGYIIQKPPVITGAASRTENQYSAGSARRPFYYLSEFSDDLEFINCVFSKNDWKTLVKDDAQIRLHAKKILDNWKDFLPKFLMNNGFKSYGANQSLTYHRPRDNRDVESPDNSDEIRKSQIGKLYSGSSGIRKRRKYNSNEEIKRYLRHCAAALAIYFGIKNEIQCYYDDEDDIVYVATNNDGDLTESSNINNQKLSQISGILCRPYIELIERYNKRKPVQDKDKNDKPTILGKFRDKINALLCKRGSPLLRRLKHPLNCPRGLENAKFKVIEGNYGIEGLHAERKILYHLRGIKRNDELFLNSLRLGGIRRPCFICSALCFANMSQVNPGPVWVSNAASKPRDVNEMFLILDAIRSKGNVTFISFSEGHPTMDNDSDSDEGSECD